MSAPDFRLVIFDFDGTLADTFGVFGEAVNWAAARHHFRRVEPGDVDRLRGLDASAVMRELGVPFWRLPLIGRDVSRFMRDNVSRIRLFPGVEETLVRLSGAGIRVGVVSSSGLPFVNEVLGPERARLVQHFACGTALWGKQSKFRTILRQAGVPADNAVCIGDEIRDMLAAREAGIAFGAVSWGYTKPEALRAQGPAYLFNEMSEIAALLAPN